MIFTVIILLFSLISSRTSVHAASISTDSSPLILVSPTQTRQQRQFMAINDFFSKIENIHGRIENRVSKTKQEGVVTTKIETELNKNADQLSQIRENIKALDTQINFGTESAVKSRSIDAKLKDTVLKLKSVYASQKQSLATIKKLIATIKKMPASTQSAQTQL